MRTALLGVMLAGTDTLLCTDVRALPLDNGYDVYDYPHSLDDNLS